MAKNKGVFFTVRGRGEFPLDMLRYDMCFPADAYAVEDLSARNGIDSRERLKMREIRLGSLKRWQHELTPARWESYGWSVINVCEE